MSSPTARPIGSSLPDKKPLVSGEESSDLAHDIYGLPPASVHIGSTGLAEPDLLILRITDRLRLLTAGQLRHLLDAKSDAAGRALRRRLLRLVNSDYLQRLDRRIGGVRGGSDGHIYVVGRQGQRLLRPDKKRTRRYREPGWPFLRHTLAISTVYTDLVRAARSQEIHLRQFVPEPHSWRTQQGAGSEVHLRPDAFALVEAGRKRQYWFIEVDLGTESRPALRRKMQRYVDWLHTGYEQQRLGGVFPRVLWHAPDSRRTTMLTKLAAEPRWPAGLHVTSGLPLDPTGERSQ